ncbi:serine hydrolase [Xanthomonas citri pv. citri]|nr:serine hydrolase [Xanthomonas citri pv. citri]
MTEMRTRRRFRPLAIGLFGALLPLALSSTAQTPAPTAAALQAATVAQSPTAPLPYRTSLPANQVLAPAAGFDVAAFESMADQLTYGNRVPGMAMAIVQGGKVLSARGYGVTDVNHPQPVDGHTVFRLASLSKAFAGTMAGLLVNDGVLRWDSKVVDYVPGFQLSDNAATRQLTAASGSFYEQSVERRIFKPLGMNDASMGLAGIQASPHWARPHVRSRNGWVSLTPKPTYYRLAPAAGVNASASDMAQWLLAHTGHRTDVLPAPLLATLHAPLISTPGEMRSGWRHERVDAASYALGWRVFDYAGHQVVFHAGAVQGYRGLVALLPERDLGVAILWNGESGLPSGMLPTILDRALGLPAKRWLDIDVDGDFGSENMLAEKPDPAGKGASSGKSVASPR